MWKGKTPELCQGGQTMVHSRRGFLWLTVDKEALFLLQTTRFGSLHTATAN